MTFFINLILISIEIKDKGKARWKNGDWGTYEDMEILRLNSKE